MNSNTTNNLPSSSTLTFNLDRHKRGIGRVQWLYSSIHGLAYVRDLQTNDVYPATRQSLKKIK
jgi:hypothetical protein